ncbi:DNA-3-methyladenine glycosylase I [Sneathiella chinensis]|uniref:DNA-3-methyladenine glycosylase n=1 Tax=Sneathiella chinensis TaxID=349750 RepID=A0ABQ5U3F5_9PROT|nr:DNA-3-methyladenine glycosylase I [Sneathiella chinensis]GLQ05814.1 DNA-3-methyladenine glycosylase [Sneathiella chinensis]
MENLINLGQDNKPRCKWCGDDPQYVAYHDEEWGVPIHDSRALFEKLILDGFQAGLSWITILRKRDNFLAAFDNFNPELIAGYGPDKVESLMQDTGIVRNRAKIEGTIKGAQLFLDIEQKEGGFSNLLWGYLEGQPLQNNWKAMSEVPAQTALSQAISKDLKSRGFKFVGPTIVYAFMQAVGMINDHQVDCFRHSQVKSL